MKTGVEHGHPRIALLVLCGCACGQVRPEASPRIDVDSHSETAERDDATTDPAGPSSEHDEDDEPFIQADEPFIEAEPTMVPSVDAPNVGGGASMGVGVDSVTPCSPVEAPSQAPMSNLPSAGLEAQGLCAALSLPLELGTFGMLLLVDASESQGALAVAPYYSREHKWDPMVAAIETFLGASNASTTWAALSFFPSLPASSPEGSDAGLPSVAEASCRASSYQSAAVPRTDVPSDAFAAALSEAAPETDDAWRVGRPLAPALEGWGLAVGGGFDESAALVVIASDPPTACEDGADPLEAAVAAIGLLAAERAVHVVGLKNPATEIDPAPPDSTETWTRLAESAGSAPITIDTDDPGAAETQLVEALHAIAALEDECLAEIPQVPDSFSTFNPELVNVVLEGACSEPVYFAHDPTCRAPYAWRYDDELQPLRVQLCPDSCQLARQGFNQGGALEIHLGCATIVGKAPCEGTSQAPPAVCR